MRVRLALRAEPGRAPRGRQRVLRDDVLLACRLGVVHDLGGVGPQLDEAVEDLGVQPAPHGGRDRGVNGGAGELVPEADVARTHVEQVPPLGLCSGIGPVGEHTVEQRGRHATRDNRDQVHQATSALVEARRASDHRMGDRRGDLVHVARCEKLGHIERIAAGCGEHVSVVSAGEDRDSVLGQRGELHERRVRSGNVAEQREQRMLRRHFSGPDREDKQRV